uniref:Protein kinase domain-containing protein n=1 Tax=Setaria italica TaxID=4555 RepID=K3ZP23_SETIT
MACIIYGFALGSSCGYGLTVSSSSFNEETASGSNIAPPPPVVAAPRPGCPSMCGNVTIPYPFGIGVECAWPGLGSNNFDFTITCNHSFNPPRPYIGDFEVVNISLEAGEMRVFSPVSYTCYNSSNTTASNGVIGWTLDFIDTVFLISPTRNVFTAIGCYTWAYLNGRVDSSFFTGCITTCNSLHAAAQDGEECTGLGCCQSSIPTNLSRIHIFWANDDSYTPTNVAWEYSPCSFAFIAEKGWYNFTRSDLTRDANKTFTDRVGDTTIPMVLDWSIRDGGSCRAPPKDAGASAKSTAPACISRNSFCVNATQGPGYLCNCSKGYTGNPYITDGCTNINECSSTTNGPCGMRSTCEDTDGDYNCKCKFNRKGDGKSENGCYQYVFPPYAIAAVAITVAVILACLSIILLIRRKQRKLFNKNGGDILKEVGIKIFTEGEVDTITKSYRNRIGGGYFGDVYKGTIIDDPPVQVAVKKVVRLQQKSLRGEAPQHEQEKLWKEGFVREICFQFKVKHPNMVRLIGCCLETDVPILVFEFVGKGSLHEVLHGANKLTLSLPKRLDIAIGSAEALSHMHSHGDYKHVHGDVKSANILLDDDLNPKVSDFGSSKLLSVKNYAMEVAADGNYLDPVYHKTGHFTVKSDVYSFGVVLLELITRKKPRYGSSDANILTIDFNKSIKNHSNGREMYDAEVLSDDNAQSHRYMECLDMVGALAVRCLSVDADERPTMAEVVDELNQAKSIACGSSCSDLS